MVRKIFSSLRGLCVRKTVLAGVAAALCALCSSAWGTDYYWYGEYSDWEDGDNWKLEDGSAGQCPGESDTAIFSAAHFYSGTEKELNLTPVIDREFKIQSITIEDGVKAGLEFYYNNNGAPSLTVASGDLKIAALISNNSSCALTLSSGALTVTGTATLAGGTITTSGSQTYSGAVTISDAVIFSAGTTSGIVRFEGGFTASSSVNVTGSEIWSRGNIEADSLEFTGKTSLLSGCATITTTGTQTFTGAVLVNENITITGTTVAFSSTLDSWSSTDPKSVTINGNAVFTGAVGGTGALALLSVSGTSTVKGAVTTSGDQNYGGSVNISSWINFTSKEGSIFFGSEASPASINATNTYSGVIASAVGSSTECIYFYGGFSGSSLNGLTIYGNAAIYGTNDFSNTNISIQYNSFRFSPTVKFESGKWQTISSISTSTEEEYPVTLTSTGSGKWYAYFSTKPAASSFAYTVIENSRSVSASGSTALNSLGLTPDSSTLTDADTDNPTTEGWFNFPDTFYWLGGTDTSWSTVTNWSQDGETALSSTDSAPDSTSGTSKITIVRSSSNALKLSSDINIKTLTVNKDMSVDFGTSDVVATTITNNGTVRIGGSLSISAAMVNGSGSTVEYYGGSLSSLAWDGGSSSTAKQYENLLIAESCSVSSSDAVSVAGDATLNTSGDVSLSGDNRFTGGVVVTKAGDVTLSGANIFTGGLEIASAGAVTLNSKSVFTIASVSSSESLSVTDTSTVTLAGSVETTGTQTYSAPLDIKGNLSGSELLFNGAVSVSAEATLSAAGGATFSGTVDGASSGTAGVLAIKGSSSSVVFNGAVGGTQPLSALTAEGNASFGGIAAVSGALRADGDATFAADVTAASLTVGGTATLAAAGSQSLITTGAQSYTGAVTVNSQAAISVGGAATFSGALTVNESTTIGAGGAATFGGAVTLGADMSVGAAGGAVFSSTVDCVSADKASALSITDTSSAAVFNGAVGAAYPLGALSFAGDATFSGDVSAASITVGGTTTLAAAGSQGVTTTGAQSYTGAVTVSSQATIGADGGAAFSSTVTAATGKTLTVDSKANESTFSGEVSGSLVLRSPATFSESNSFTNLTVESSTNASSLAGLTVTFKGGSTQSVSGALKSTGTSSDYITLKSDDGSSYWTYEGSGSTVNFEYTYIAYSASSSALSLAPSSSSVSDWGLSQSPASTTTTNWFVTAYYWRGTENSSWTTAGNWYYDEAGSSVAASAPPYTGGASDIVVVQGSSSSASPYILALTSDIDVNSLLVSSDAAMDFGRYSVTATTAITNNGTVRISGNYTSQKITAASTENGSTSTVEYYGSSLSFLPWGSEYQNIKITGNASSLPAITVAGKTIIETSGEVSLINANIFTGGVRIISGGDVDLNAGGSFTIEAGASCASLDIYDYTGNSVVTLAGDVATTGAQTYIASAKIDSDAVLTAGTGVTFSGTLSIDAGKTLTVDSKSVTSRFTGAVTGSLVLRSPAVFSAENSFTDLTIESLTNEGSLAGAGMQVIFPGGLTQSVSGTLACTGTVADRITLMSDSQSSKWIYSGSVEPSNFKYTYIAYSQSKTELSIASSRLKVSDWGLTQNAPALTTENWFITKYYWLGDESKEWSNPLNWSKDGSSLSMLSADDDSPDYTNGISEILAVQGSSLEQSPYILSLSYGINVNTLTVSEGATVDLGTSGVTAASIINNGIVRIGGEQSVTGAITNGGASTVEYYGTDLTLLAWGDEYQNLLITGGLSSADALSVAGTTTLDASGDVSLTGDNTFNGTVTIASGKDVALSSISPLLIADGSSCGSLSVTGSGTAVLAGSVTTTGAQSYDAAVSVTADSAVSAGAGAAFNGAVDIADGAALSVSSGAEQSSFSGVVAGSLILRSPAVLSADNLFADLTVETSTNAQNLAGGGLSVSFAGGSAQTVSGTLKCAGTEDNYITLTSTDSTEWTFSGVAAAENFAYTYIAYSRSVNALYIAPSELTVMDLGFTLSSSAMTTSNWFITAYYWLGAVSSSWTEAGNWSYDGTVSAMAVSYPPYAASMSDIVIAQGSSAEQNPFILRLEEGIVTKTLAVNKGATVDFGESSVTAAAATNDGTVRIGGSQSVMAGTIDNGAESTVEYYGALLTSLAWGTSYQNIRFSAGASAGSAENPLQTAISVEGTAVFANGEGNTIYIEGGNEFTGLVMLGETGATTGSRQQAGNIYLSGANIFAGGVEIASAGSVALESESAFTIASVSSSETLSVTDTGTVTLAGSVETTGAQTYNAPLDVKGNLSGSDLLFNGTVSVSAAAKLSASLGEVSFADAVALGADLSIEAAGGVRFSGTVDSASLDIACALSVTGASSVTEFGGEAGGIYSLGALSVKGDAVFGADVSAASVYVGGTSSFTAESQSVTAAGAQRYDGSLGSFSSLSLSGKTVELNGIGFSLNSAAAGSVSISAADAISLYVADYISSGRQAYSCPGGVRVLSGSVTNGVWSAGENEIALEDTDLFLDSPRSTLTVSSALSAANIYLYSGTLALSSGAEVSSMGDFAVWGASYSADDPRYSGTDTRFAFYEDSSAPLSYTASSSYGGEVSAPGAQISVSGSFYANGADLSGFNLIVPDNSLSSPVFNAASSATQRQWGQPYAVAFNSTITSVSVSSLSSSGASYLAAGSGATQNCTDGGGNTNVQFNVPKIAKAYTVYDDVIYVEFDMSLENSNGEISSNIALASSSPVNGGVWISSGGVRIAGAYSDSDCTAELSSSSGDVSSFYLKSSENWNTDATGSSSGSEKSTDRSGVHRTLTADLSFLEGLFTAAQGHTMCRGYGAGLEEGESAPSFSSVEDQASPVLVGVYTGQETHSAGKASEQSTHDAHNFVEFRYSEAVDIGSLASDGGDLNIRASSSLGGISTEGTDGLVFAGLGSVSSGLLDSFSKNGSSSPHSLYRKFSVKAGAEEALQSHSIRVSIAGYVEGTVSFADPRNPSQDGEYNNWIGCIREARTPSGTALPIENSGIKDLAGNSLDAAGTQSHPLPELSVRTGSDEDGDGIEDSGLLYGEWDVLPPVIAPFVENYEQWSSWASSDYDGYSEIIGTAYSASDTSLRNLEIHLFDNNKAQAQKWSAWWKTKDGWNNLLSADTPLEDEKLPETRGGARPYIGSDGKQNSSSITSGGIRLCSLDGGISSFSYRTVIENTKSKEKSFEEGSDIYQVVYGGIYRKKTNLTTSADGLYLRLPLPENSIPVRTSFVLSYNPAGSYITDLAGNLLSSSYSAKTDFSSIEITPPAVSMTLAPVGENKIYAVFTKELAYNSVTLGQLDAESLSAVLEEIKDSFVIVPAGSGSGVTESSIEITGCEYVSSSSDYTALLFTLERNVTLSDIESYWLRDIGHYTGGSLDSATDLAGFNVADTKISDYLGNFMEQYSGHTLSDFALNVAAPVYAYSDSSFGGGWSEDEIYGTQTGSSSSNSVHDFTGGLGNSNKLTGGSDIIIQVSITGGQDSSGQDIAVDNRVFDLVPSAKSALTDDMVSDRINTLLGRSWRVWLPTSLESLATRANTNTLKSVSDPVNADSGKGFLWNYTLSDSEYGFASGEEVQFVFKVADLDGNAVMIDHDADGWGGATSATSKVPLYALSMPLSRIQAGDFSFVDLWSFGLKNIQKQRGGVTILNNVIDVGTREQTLIEVDMPEEGNLNVFVMTLDGNIVKRLAHGRTAAGTHYYRWNGTNNSGKAVARGLYFIRVAGPGIDETRKVLCVKN